jgi:hypothetical protein
MTVKVSTFSPTTKLKDGHNGLVVTEGAASKATITGENLSDGLKVVVLYPAGSSDPKYQWEGTTSGTDPKTHQQCTAEVKQKKHVKGESIRDDSVTVSVTVGDSSSTNVNTYAGTPSP